MTKCTLCGKILKDGGNRTNLFKVNSTQTSSRQKQLDNCLLEMVSQDLQPAEDGGFIRFVAVLDPHYNMPSRRTLMRMLPAK